MIRNSSKLFADLFLHQILPLDTWNAMLTTLRKHFYAQSPEWIRQKNTLINYFFSKRSFWYLGSKTENQGINFLPNGLKLYTQSQNWWEKFISLSKICLSSNFSSGHLESNVDNLAKKNTARKSERNAWETRKNREITFFCEIFFKSKCSSWHVECSCHKPAEAFSCQVQKFTTNFQKW